MSIPPSRIAVAVEGPDLDTVAGPDGQYLLVNVATREYLKVSDQAYRILLDCDGLDPQEASRRVARSEGIGLSDAFAFFDKVIALGFAASPHAPSAPAQPRLREVWLHVTALCNLSCPMCYFGSDVKPSVRPDANLAPDVVRRVIHAIATARPERVVVSGGEPLVRSDIVALLTAIKRQGPRVVLLTNGTQLTPELCRRLAPVVDHVSISLDGATAATHERVRGEGTFAATLEGIANLQREGFHRIAVVPTIRRDTVAEMPALNRLAEELGVTVGSRCLFTARGSAQSCRDEYEITIEDLLDLSVREMRRQLEHPGSDAADLEAVMFPTDTVALGAPPLNRCGAGREKISIDVDGSVYPCQFLHEERFRLGHVFDFPDLRDVVSTPRALGVARFTAGRIENVAPCRSCDVRHFCGGGCIVSNLADSIPVDRCPSHCDAMRRFYQAVVWRWRADLSAHDNLAAVFADLTDDPDPSPRSPRGRPTHGDA